MLLIQVLLIQVSTIIIFDNLYVQNQSTTTAQALARTKTRMTTWLNSNFRGRWKEVSGPNVTLASNQWMIVMRIGKQGGNYDYFQIAGTDSDLAGKDRPQRSGEVPVQIHGSVGGSVCQSQRPGCAVSAGKRCI